MKRFFSAEPFAQSAIIALLRVVIGIFLIIHGMEVFDAAKMKADYINSDYFKDSDFMLYLGKATEFVAGVLLVLGLFTRVAALLTIGTLGYICFFIGSGKFWMYDQHPFMFVLFGLLFLFAGPGAFSLDGRLFRSSGKPR